jgi:N-acetylneuraminic acid mutarotase
LPVSVSGYALAAFEGRIYLFGGWNDKYLHTVYRYDLALENWERLSDMPTARSSAFAAALTDRIEIIGGYNDSGGLSVSEAFFPNRDGTQQNPWQASGELPQDLYAMGGATLADIIYLVGGENGQEGELPCFQKFSRSDTWQKFPCPENAHWSGLALVSRGEKLYAFGGNTPDGLMETTWNYQAIYMISIPVVR